MLLNELNWSEPIRVKPGSVFPGPSVRYAQLPWGYKIYDRGDNTYGIWATRRKPMWDHLDPITTQAVLYFSANRRKGSRWNAGS